ncbi:MAG: hydrolase [Thermoleophilia bacterium]
MDDASNLVATLEKWCAIPSGSGNPDGLAEMRSALAARLAPLECELQDVPLASGTAALVARRRPEAALQVLLSGHLDTVYGPDHPVRECRHEGERLVGPGVADMKGGLVVMCAALEAFEAHPDRDGLGWTVVAVPDEELGSPHSGALTRELARRCSLAVVMEPASEGNPVRSRMGVGVFRLVVQGRAAHAGRNPQEGRNAVVALAELVTDVAGLHDAARGVLVNVARLGGGGATNVVPEFAVAEVDVRVTRPAQARDIPERLEYLAGAVSRRRDVTIRVEGHFHRPPMMATPGSLALLQAVVECGVPLGLHLEGADVGGGSDAALIADEGVPVVDGMGVVGGELHSALEYCETASLGQRAALLSGLLVRLARAEVWLPEWGPR